MTKETPIKNPEPIARLIPIILWEAGRSAASPTEIPARSNIIGSKSIVTVVESLAFVASDGEKGEAGGGGGAAVCDRGLWGGVGLHVGEELFGLASGGRKRSETYVGRRQ
jgi:hypothetical protein